MTYQKPELFLVGAAQGLVLGSLDQAEFTDPRDVSSNCRLGSSRNTFEICE